MGRGNRPIPKSVSNSRIIEEKGTGKGDNTNTANDGMLLDIVLRNVVCV